MVEDFMERGIAGEDVENLFKELKRTSLTLREILTPLQTST